MAQEVTAWARRRNHLTKKQIDEQFSTEDARTKLRRLYPAYED
jgi:hypothetical protein